MTYFTEIQSTRQEILNRIRIVFKRFHDFKDEMMPISQWAKTEFFVSLIGHFYNLYLKDFMILKMR